MHRLNRMFKIAALFASGTMALTVLAQPVPPQDPPPSHPVGLPADNKKSVTTEDLKVGEGAVARAGSCVVLNVNGSIKGTTGSDYPYMSENLWPVVLRTGAGGVPVSGLIKGIDGMKVGGKRKITIAPAAGYGEKDTNVGTKLIPANSDLVYEVELVDMMIVEDLKVGEGAECKPGTAVVAHYKGTFKTDGKEFDSSYSRNQPAPFPLANVIRGWTEGVPGMKVGGKRKLTIPYQFAYGEKGRAPKIPAKADLVFEIELVATLETIDLKVGDGAEVPAIQRGRPAPTVKVHYAGTLKEGGKEFDSSYKRNEPIEFSLAGVIQGWTYGIPGMKVGGKRKLIIPWQFAYGEEGSPPDIGPKADLVFEVELLGVR